MELNSSTFRAGCNYDGPVMITKNRGIEPETYVDPYAFYRGLHGYRGRPNSRITQNIELDKTV